MPKVTTFGPLAEPIRRRETVVMTVDEYETIRLMDLEGMNQEETAEKMDIARTSAQRVYHEAKRKLADVLVNGKVLVIEGGAFRLCAGESHCHSKRGCQRKRKEEARGGTRRTLQEKKKIV